MGNFGLLFFLCFGLTPAQTQTTERIWILLGGTLELRPPPGSPRGITGVQWRHFDDIAAEWMSGDPAPDVYNNFKTRATLNTTSGRLTVRNMTKEVAGEYSILLNNNHLPQKYKVDVLNAVPTPYVSVRSTVGDRFNLSCAGDVKGAEPVTHFWNLGVNRSWVELGATVEMENNETTRQMESFSCKMKNPVSEKESEPKGNPLYPKPASTPGPISPDPKPEESSGLGALAVLPILALVALIGVGIWKKDVIKERLCAGNGEENRSKVGPSDSSVNTPLNAAANGTQPPNSA